ncbi:MAG: hypothetical protein GY863_04270, partial [bacterium]|nr:hypothetical protein [bacterium]
ECPEFVLSHAFNKGQAIATRTKTYRDAAENNTLLLSFHVIFPGLGYIRQDGRKFIWEKYIRKEPYQE